MRQEFGSIGVARHVFGAIVAAGLLLGGSGAAQAAMYVYQLPDGTRIATDRPVNNAHYRLVRKGATTKGVGLILAARHRQFFRADRSTYDELIQRTARRHDVDHALVKAVIHAESGFNPLATSSKGACGLMQLMPATAAKYGIDDLYDPAQNIRAGVRHLKYLLTRYKSNVSLAVAAYNAGENAVARHRGIPPYSETRQYLRKVMEYRRVYAAAGDSDA
jgi:soluble lytic murein transglycosylase-like protein